MIDVHEEDNLCLWRSAIPTRSQFQADVRSIMVETAGVIDDASPHLSLARAYRSALRAAVEFALDHTIFAQESPEL